MRHSNSFATISLSLAATFAIVSISGCESRYESKAEITINPKKPLESGTQSVDSGAVESGAAESGVKKESASSLAKDVTDQEAEQTNSERKLLSAPKGTQADLEAKKNTGQDLPDAKLSKDATDFDVEPEPVDLRKHDPVFEADPSWNRLAKDYPLWIDRNKKQVIVDGRIAQIHAALEMFACPVDSGKEHESIVGVYCESELLHAALLAVGAKPGHPVIFQPEFKPAEGTKVEIEVVWEVDGKRKSTDAKNWIRDMQSKEKLKMDWVFGGSQIYVDDRTGNKYYLANGGEMVCVSNFSTAMLDIPVESSADAAEQVFETNTDEIPELGTPVRLIFKPQIEADASKDDADKTDTENAIQKKEDSNKNESK